VSLLGRPQPLGFLPTTRFWNDAERYRLVLPLVLVLTLPVTVTVLWPYLALGLVERHMRGELRRRELLAADDDRPELPTATPRRWR
jgi:hypothetical protein